MIQKESYLNVADNSGAKALQCIHVVGSTGKKIAFVGDLIICAVKKAIPGGTVKKGEVVTAIIVRTRKEHRRSDGSYIRFGDNAAVILKGGTSAKKEVEELMGTRVFGPVAREVKTRGFSKLASLAAEVL